MATPPTDRLSRFVEAALRLGGLALALVQGIFLPLTGGSEAISPPILALAAAMMGLAQAVRIDRRRGGRGGGDS